MKRFLTLSVLCGVLFLSGCRPEPGNLVVQITPSVEGAVAGEAVDFTVSVLDEEKFSIDYIIADEEGRYLVQESVDGSSFSYTFGKASNYTVSVVARAPFDWGQRSAQFEVSSAIAVPSWQLSEKSVLHGDVTSIDLSSLTDSSISVIDIRLIKKDGTDETVYLAKKVSGIFVLDTGLVQEYGNYKVQLTLKDAGGNSVFVEDDLIIMNPNNPVEVVLNASKNDFSYENQIYLAGTVNTFGNGVDEIILERRCYYGREAGINPLAEPKPDGGVDYFDPTKPINEVVTRYSSKEGGALSWDATSGEITFLDPMEYFDENGNVEESGFKWSYAKVDREAWKYLKRQKPFDMEKAFSVDYKLIVTTTADPAPVESPSVSGYPYLGKAELAQLFFWVKDVAMNRIWKMQIPRYAYGKTQDWMGSQTVSGQNGGVVSFVKDGMGGYGFIDKYSDWPGFEISTDYNISLSIGLDQVSQVNYRKELSMSFSVKTPLYSGKAELIGLGVRDFLYQWGMWVTGSGTPNAPSCGSSDIFRDGQNGKETLTTSELLNIIPNWNTLGPTDSPDDDTWWEAQFGNGYDEKDYSGILNHVRQIDGKDVFDPPSSWTKIHFFYPPTPAWDDLGVWGRKSSDWVMNYIYN